jgi:hypothetical protein
MDEKTQLTVGNVLSSMGDWDDASNWAELPQLLKEAGISVEEFGKSIYDFAEEMKKAVGAILKLTATEAIETATSLQDIIQKVRSGESEIVVDEETFKTLIAMDVTLSDDFIRTADGLEYVGNNIQDLISAIQRNTHVLEGETEEEIDTTYHVLNSLESAIANSATYAGYGQDYKAAELEYDRADAKLDSLKDDDADDSAIS